MHGSAVFLFAKPQVRHSKRQMDLCIERWRVDCILQLRICEHSLERRDRSGAIAGAQLLLRHFAADQHLVCWPKLVRREEIHIVGSLLISLVRIDAPVGLCERLSQ